jgi:hypothetical protein
MSLSMTLKRREIPVFIIIFSVIILTTDYFTSGNSGIVGGVKNTATYIKDFNRCITGAAMGAGCINLFMIHGKRIKDKVSGRWYFSLYLLALFITMLFAGLISKDNYFYKFAYTNMYTPANATTYAMTGWYIASSILRCLRLKNKELVILTVFATLQIIIQIPLTLVVIPGFEGISSWLKTYLVSPVMAAFTIGIALGVITYLIRIMMGQERTAYGEAPEVA